MKKILIWMLSVVLIASMAFAGISCKAEAVEEVSEAAEEVAEEEAAEIEEPAEQKTTTVKMVYWPGPESDAMQKVVEYYNTTMTPETGVSIEMVLFSREGFWEKQDMMMAANSNEVDMYFTASYSVGKHSPYLEPLETYFANKDLDQGGKIDTFIASAADSLKWEDTQFAIPLDVSNHFMYYRTDLMEKLLSDAAWQQKYTEIAKQELGLELTPKSPDEWVWEDYIATSLFFTKKYNPDSPTTYGTVLQASNVIYNIMIWDDVLYSLGGSWFDDEGKFNIDTPEALKAMEVYTTLLEKGATSAGATSFEHPESLEVYKTGNAAAMLHWSSASVELFDPAMTEFANVTGVAPIPGPKPSTHVHALGVGINKFSDNKEAAFKWMSFLSTPEALTLYAEGGGIPPVESVLANLGSVKPIFPYIAEHTKKYGYVETTQPETVPILEVLAVKLSSAWAGETESKDALTQAQEEIEDLLGLR